MAGQASKRKAAETLKRSSRKRKASWKLKASNPAIDDEPEEQSNEENSDNSSVADGSTTSKIDVDEESGDEQTAAGEPRVNKMQESLAELGMFVAFFQYKSYA